MLKDRARSLRKDMTHTENRIWYYLRDRRLAGYKFIRQRVIGNYIADFVCRDRWLVVEVDGGQHAEPEAMAYDQCRTNYFERLGYRVLRVWGSEVTGNIEGVLEEILAWLDGDTEEGAERKHPHPGPLPQAREGSKSRGKM